MRSELCFDRNREMIGRVRVGKHVRVFKLDRAAGENPIQVSDDSVCANLSIAKGAAISGLPEARDHWRGADLGVEIAGHDHRRFRRVALCIGQDFVKLQEPALLAASALEMKIIDHQLLAAIVQLSNQRDAPTLTPLKNGERGSQQRFRLPEARLMRESQDARGADRHGGEGRLTVISSPFLGALAKFLELGSKCIVHAGSLGKLLGDVHPLGATRAQVHFLENTKVGFALANGGEDAIQMLTSVDVPVEQLGVLPWTRRVGKGSRAYSVERIGRRGTRGARQGNRKRKEWTTIAKHGSKTN